MTNTREALIFDIQVGHEMRWMDHFDWLPAGLNLSTVAFVLTCQTLNPETPQGNTKLCTCTDHVLLTVQSIHRAASERHRRGIAFAGNNGTVGFRGGWLIRTTPHCTCTYLCIGTPRCTMALWGCTCRHIPEQSCLGSPRHGHRWSDSHVLCSDHDILHVPSTST